LYPGFLIAETYFLDEPNPFRLIIEGKGAQKETVCFILQIGYSGKFSVAARGGFSLK
jgi:hypothetical protein